ncbi:MAG: WD40 repeat domain-containing protein [Candidatus Poribacteria bacterium]|nr:WD40 repeat domain-containing protein [Candidatus Poribacteria bacterium]
MENRNTQADMSFSFDDSDVAKWALPEGATARLGRGSVRDMAFSPDGQHFAVGTAIGLWLYEFSALTPIALWETDRGFIDRVTFSPDSRWLASYTLHEALRVWDIQNESCIAEMEFRDRQDRRDLSKPVFSKDGERLVVFSGHQQRMKKIQAWCPYTGTRLSETEIPSTYDVYPTCFSQDLSLLAGTSYDINNRPTAEFIAVWDVETAEQIARFDWLERWGRLCFSPCGKFLAASGREGGIHVWDIETGNLEQIYTEHEDAQMHPYYPPEGGLIAAVVFPSQSKIEIQHLEKDEKIDTFEHKSKYGFVRFSESGTQLAYTNKGEIKIWTKGRSTAQAFPTIQGHAGTVGSLVFTSDEKTLVTAYWGRNMFLWDVSTQRAQRPTKEELPDRIRDVYPTSSGKILAVGGDENILEVCEFGNSEPLAEIAIPEPGLSSRTGTDALALTGQRLARAGGDRNIYVWEHTPSSNEIDESGNWEKCATLIGHPEHSRALALSPDGKRLASISITRPQKYQERTILLWDIDTGKQIAQLPPTVLERGGYRSTDVGIAFSPDGDIIAGGFWNEIILWDATDAKTLMTIPQSEENQRPITLCFSPCGRYLAAGAWWKGGLKKTSICLWEVATGKNIATFWGHTTDVQCFAFSQDGTLLVSGGHDGAIYLWDLTPYL